MALDNCPDCGREISATAKVCPHCGGKTRYARKTEDDKASSLVIRLFIVMGIFTFLSIVAGSVG